MPDNDILPLKMPRLRWTIATRTPGEPWVDTDVTENLEETIDVVKAALECGQCVMVEPIRHGKAG